MSLLHVDIVSLFPEICRSVLGESIIGRAQKNGLVEIRSIDLRNYSHDARRTVDDTPFGGGAGMVLKPEPLFECVKDLTTERSHVALLCPQGAPFCQKTAQRLSKEEHLVLICGHYEGLDERARQCLMDEEISLGDYVLTNGAIAAAVVADAVIRLLPGVLGSDESSDEESFSNELLLEYPQYTRPSEFKGMCVPPVLLSGNHRKISEWREEQRVVRTVGRRPDLISPQLKNVVNGDDNEHN